MTVLVNNAGIISGNKFFDLSDNMIDLTFKVNTVAHFWVYLFSLSPSVASCLFSYFFLTSSNRR